MKMADAHCYYEPNVPPKEMLEVHCLEKSARHIPKSNGFSGTQDRDCSMQHRSKKCSADQLPRQSMGWLNADGERVAQRIESCCKAVGLEDTVVG